MAIRHLERIRHKKLPIGKQEFLQIVEGDYVYVDKTQYLTQLAEDDIPIFLARPRRFGKSLRISTFEELFSGNRNLLENQVTAYQFKSGDSIPINMR